MNFLLALAVSAAAASAGRFDPALVDKKVSPCENFFEHACGGWLASNEIPADKAAWGRFHELIERNQETLRGLLDGGAAASTKSGAYYKACMDEAAIEAKGAAPLKPTLDRIAALKREDIPAEIARLHSAGNGALFGYWSLQDLDDSTKMIAVVDQGGLGLPDRDYYFNKDAKSGELRTAYTDHMAKMFVLLGQDAASAKSDAERVMDFEVQLASASKDKVFRRDPRNLNHKMTKAELKAMAPGLDWDAYFAGVPGPRVDGLNVASPEFFTRAGELAKKAPLEQWKAYLRYHAARSQASFLSKAFVEERFDFYGRKLTGAKELEARWKRCVSATNEHLGEDLGKVYVEKTFGEKGKARMMELIANLRKALAEDIKSLDWMSAETKTRALKKLEKFNSKIGYPDQWRDYSFYEVKADDAYGNAARGDYFEWKRQLDKIGRPIDRTEWHMSPPTVNAYYDPQMNEVVFPAGILQPPFYDNDMDDAVNYGGIGMVIGHEFTHGFDDEGRHYDADGNVKDWWTAEDAKRFEEKATCFVEQYSGFTAVDDVKLNGKFTLGENTADNGGSRVAYAALMEALKGKPRRKIDGYTPEQRFFLGEAQTWCVKFRDEDKRRRAAVDPHAPGYFRVNGTVMNMPEFAKAFSCKAGQPMVRAKACRVW